MSEYVKLAAGAGDQYLATVAEIQENFLKFMSSFNSWMPTVTPPPTPSFAADLPTPREVAETSFSFTEKLLKQQKTFTEKLLAISTPPTTDTSARL